MQIGYMMEMLENVQVCVQIVAEFRRGAVGTRPAPPVLPSIARGLGDALSGCEEPWSDRDQRIRIHSVGKHL